MILSQHLQHCSRQCRQPIKQRHTQVRKMEMFRDVSENLEPHASGTTCARSLQSGTQLTALLKHPFQMWAAPPLTSCAASGTQPCLCAASCMLDCPRLLAWQAAASNVCCAATTKAWWNVCGVGVQVVGNSVYTWRFWTNFTTSTVLLLISHRCCTAHALLAYIDFCTAQPCTALQCQHVVVLGHCVQQW